MTLNSQFTNLTKGSLIAKSAQDWSPLEKKLLKKKENNT